MAKWWRSESLITKRVAKIRICADGAANRLHDYNQLTNSLFVFECVFWLTTSYLIWSPGILTLLMPLWGNTLKVWYTLSSSKTLTQGVQFHHDTDEYSTDFDKTLAEVAQFESANVIGPLNSPLTQAWSTTSNIGPWRPWRPGGSIILPDKSIIQSLTSNDISHLKHEHFFPSPPRS